MKYFWKSLDVILTIIMVFFMIPLGILTFIRYTILKKTDPEFNTLASMVTDSKKSPEDTIKTLEEMLKILGPKIAKLDKETVASAWESANKTIAENSCTEPVINSIIPRIANMPPQPISPSNMPQG